jgi:acyl-CoA dehydrogenase
VTAFLIDRSMPGLSFGSPLRKMGARGILNCSIHLDAVWVPDENRLGVEGSGFAGLMRSFEASRVLAAAAAVGLGRAACSAACDYAAGRRGFGQTGGGHQSVAFRIADMVTRTEAARLMVWRAARRLDEGRPCATESSMAKLTATETAMWITWAALQTLGGYGYSRDNLVEKWFRDAKLGEIVEGTSDIQRVIISRGILGTARPS